MARFSSERLGIFYAIFKLVAESLNLTGALSLKLYPHPSELKPHWSTFALKRAIIFCNFFWFLCLCALFFLLVSTYFLVSNYKNLNFSAQHQVAKLEEEIKRLQTLNSYTEDHAIALAQNIQQIVDSAETSVQRDFLKKVVPQALQLQVNYGVPASATVAMAIFESRYGSSELAREHFNFFGLKAFPSAWDGAKTYQPTIDSGKPTQAFFRSFSSLEEGIVGYAKFLAGSDRYQPAFRFRKGDLFVKAILAAGYCPDKDYFSHIQGLMERHHLALLDLPENGTTQEPAQTAPNHAATGEAEMATVR